MRRVAVLTGAVGLSLILGAQPALAQSAYAVADGWTPPLCGQVTGDGSMTYTWNAGRHLTATSQPMKQGTIVSDVDVLATPNDLLAVAYGGRLSTSADAGCTWTELAILGGWGTLAISPAADGSAYVWSKYGEREFYRVTGATVTKLPPLPTDEFGMLALAADPRDAAHVRAVTARGNVLDSSDGGQTFQKRGTTPTPVLSSDVYGYDAAIGGDLDRLVLGTAVDGVFASQDGGQTWTKAALGGAGHRVNAFTVTVSPVDPSVVWAMGLDITELDSGGTPAQGRHIFRSTDGGRTFQPAVDHVPGKVTLTNGLPLVADPVDRDQVYFVFGTWFAGYGTDLFSYNARLDQLQLAHNDYDDVKAIAFNPRFPAVMYLGLSEER